MLLTVPGDYMVIEKQYFISDFVRCLLSVINGAVCLLVYVAFAKISSLGLFLSGSLYDCALGNCCHINSDDDCTERGT
jgi:hypothetical protein